MSETSTDTAAAMRLRADPPRVTRISRKVIIGLGVVAGLGIGALSGNEGDGAAIGAISGAVGGAIIGDQNARNERYSRNRRSDW